MDNNLTTDKKPRVVVTGMGVVTPSGTGLQRMWDALMRGESAPSSITSFDASEFAVRFAAQVTDFDPADWMDYREARRFDRCTQFALAAARQAIGQAGLSIENEDRERIGVVIGSGMGGLNTIQAGYEALMTKGPMRVNPTTGAMMLPDMPAGQVSISLGLLGPNFCIVSACATGSHAVGEAYEILRRGDAEVMITGATEAGVTPFALAAFHRTGAMSTRNDDPKHASRPFDAERDGFVFGEGCGVVVLETLEHAMARGAAPIVELSGYGATADAYHISAPREDGSGAARAMKQAIAKAGVEHAAIGYINAHGTGTPMNDLAETRAIKTVFGDRAYRIPVSSTKSMMGHLMGAAGGVEAVITCQAMVTGVLPPTINYAVADPECDLDYVPNTARTLAAPLEAAISNSFGFGGHNASLLFRRFVAGR